MVSGQELPLSAVGGAELPFSVALLEPFSCRGRAVEGIEMGNVVQLPWPVAFETFQLPGRV